MPVEAAERIVGEIAHLSRPEALVDIVKAQPALGKPLIRALQVAFNLRRRQAGAIEHPPAGKHARQHHQRPARVGHLPRPRPGDALFHQRHGVNRGAAAVAEQGILATQEHALLQRLRQGIGVVDVVGVGGVGAIAVHKLLQHDARVGGLGGSVVERALQHKAGARQVFAGEEVAPHSGKIVIDGRQAQLRQQARCRILGIGSTIRGAVEVSDDGKLARARGHPRRRALIAHEHVGAPGGFDLARGDQARDIHARTRELVQARLRPQAHRNGGLAHASKGGHGRKLLGPPRLRAVRHRAHMAFHNPKRFVLGRIFRHGGKRREQRAAPGELGFHGSSRHHAIAPRIRIERERVLPGSAGKRRQQKVGDVATIPRLDFNRGEIAICRRGCGDALFAACLQESAQSQPHTPEIGFRKRTAPPQGDRRPLAAKRRRHALEQFHRAFRSDHHAGAARLRANVRVTVHLRQCPRNQVGKQRRLGLTP